MATMTTSFAALLPGDRARITGFHSISSAYRNRLLSLGMTPGTEFTVKRVAPLGDPVEILLRGFRLSLRRAEAEGLQVEML
jgi:ferrous iron transport protein A